MLKKFLFLLVLILVFSPISFAETLSDFMFSTASSWNVEPNKPSILPTLSVTSSGTITLYIQEHNGVDAKIDSITVYVFDDDMSSVGTGTSAQINPFTIGGNQKTQLNARASINPGQWVGCKIGAGGKFFYCIVQSGGAEEGSTDPENDTSNIEETTTTYVEESTTTNNVMPETENSNTQPLTETVAKPLE